MNKWGGGEEKWVHVLCSTVKNSKIFKKIAKKCQSHGRKFGDGMLL